MINKAQMFLLFTLMIVSSSGLPRKSLGQSSSAKDGHEQASEFVTRALQHVSDEPEYYTERHEQPFKDDVNGHEYHLISLSTGGRTGRGVICLFSETGDLISKCDTRPLRGFGHVRIAKSTFIFWREISASGTGLHEEKMFFRLLSDPNKELLNCRVLKMEEGPYPQSLRVDGVIYVSGDHLIDVQTVVQSEAQPNGDSRPVSRSVKIVSHTWNAITGSFDDEEVPMSQMLTNANEPG